MSGTPKTIYFKDWWCREIIVVQKKKEICCEYFQEFDRNHKDVVGMYRTHLISAVQVCFFHQIAV